ncbi:DUF2262 domain-containing protein [Collimonas sp. NPDC087041]|uniref:DUF2262 domain-containing protein n=1 Tax=Collimonas sp. NPDC087041 TaxID=3363960 RepID=UPI003828754C
MEKILGDLIERERLMYDRFSLAPKTLVTGVISATGVVCGRLRGQELWSMTVRLDAWRIGNGPIRIERLVIHKKMNDDELRQLKAVIRPNSIFSAIVRLDEDAPNYPQALYEVSAPYTPVDVELEDYVHQMSKTVTIESDQFGTFTLDRRLGWFLGKLSWNGSQVDLNLGTDQLEEMDGALKVATHLFNETSIWSSCITTYAAENLLPLKNDSWLRDDEAELTIDEFQSKMHLRGITVYPNGAFDFEYNDGGLFWGHAISVSGTIHSGPTRAEI